LSTHVYRSKLAEIADPPPFIANLSAISNFLQPNCLL
jgi:hypothetical protein